MPFPNYQGGGANPRGGLPAWLNSFLGLFRRPAPARPGLPPQYQSRYPGYRPPVPARSVPTPPTPRPPAYNWSNFNPYYRGQQPVQTGFNEYYRGVSPIGQAQARQQQARQAPAPAVAGPRGYVGGAGANPNYQRYQRNVRAYAPVPQAAPRPRVWGVPSTFTPMPAGPLGNVEPIWSYGYPSTPLPGYSEIPGPGAEEAPYPGYGGGYGGWGGGGGGGGYKPKQYATYAEAPQQAQGLNIQRVQPQQDYYRPYQQQAYLPRWMQSLVQWQV